MIRQARDAVDIVLRLVYKEEVARVPKEERYITDTYRRATALHDKAIATSPLNAFNLEMENKKKKWREKT